MLDTELIAAETEKGSGSKLESLFDIVAFSEFRAPDPADLFPRVHSGELPAHSIDTAPFRALDRKGPPEPLGFLHFL